MSSFDGGTPAQAVAMQAGDFTGAINVYTEVRVCESVHVRWYVKVRFVEPCPC